MLIKHKIPSLPKINVYYHIRICDINVDVCLWFFIECCTFPPEKSKYTGTRSVAKSFCEQVYQALLSCQKTLEDQDCVLFGNSIPHNCYSNTALLQITQVHYKLRHPYLWCWHNISS